MIDDQVAGDQGVDLGGAGLVAGHPHHGGAHSGQIDHGGHAGEVLEDHPPRDEWDLHLAYRSCVEIGEGPHVGFGHQVAVEMAQRRLEQDLDRIGEALHIPEGIEAVDGPFAERGGDLFGGAKGVKGHARSVFRGTG